MIKELNRKNSVGSLKDLALFYLFSDLILIYCVEIKRRGFDWGSSLRRFLRTPFLEKLNYSGFRRKRLGFMGFFCENSIYSAYPYFLLCDAELSFSMIASHLASWLSWLMTGLNPSLK